ncbi:MAG: hypothetical protein AAF773_07030 [Cyanobacteria bacterium P01_D01_bin.115]
MAGRLSPCFVRRWSDYAGQWAILVSLACSPDLTTILGAAAMFTMRCCGGCRAIAIAVESNGLTAVMT